MKINFLISGLAIFLLCSCGNNDSQKENSAQNKPPKSTLETEHLDSAMFVNAVDSSEIQVKDSFSWDEAQRACPKGFRIPSAEEFQKIPPTALDVSSHWWTANITADSAGDALQGIAVKYSGKKFQTYPAAINQQLKAICIQDTAQSWTVVNEIPQQITESRGVITAVAFKPYFEGNVINMGCADCCCSEGNGGYLEVSFQRDDASLDTFTVWELDDQFCGALAFGNNETPEEIQKESDGCIPGTMENFNILPLFQPGVQVHRTACKSQVYIKSTVDNGISEISCGENIRLEFPGKIQAISLATKDDPEEEKECNYSILKPDGSSLTVKGNCSNVEPGVKNISVTVSKEALISKEMNPVWNMDYPCCYGETSSHQISDISFSTQNNSSSDKSPQKN